HGGQEDVADEEHVAAGNFERLEDAAERLHAQDDGVDDEGEPHVGPRARTRRLWRRRVADAEAASAAKSRAVADRLARARAPEGRRGGERRCVHQAAALGGTADGPLAARAAARRASSADLTAATRAPITAILTMMPWGNVVGSMNAFTAWTVMKRINATM